MSDEESVRWAAFRAGYEAAYRDPGNAVVESDIRDDYNAWLGEDIPEEIFKGNGDRDTDEPFVIEAEVDTAYHILDLTRGELIEEAFAGNINRKHHLEAAVECFGDIGTLLQAEHIIRQVLDPRDEPEEPTGSSTEEVDTSTDR